MYKTTSEPLKNNQNQLEPAQDQLIGLEPAENHSQPRGSENRVGRSSQRKKLTRDASWEHQAESDPDRPTGRSNRIGAGCWRLDVGRALHLGRAETKLLGWIGRVASGFSGRHPGLELLLGSVLIFSRNFTFSLSRLNNYNLIAPLMTLIKKYRPLQ